MAETLFVSAFIRVIADLNRRAVFHALEAMLFVKRGEVLRVSSLQLFLVVCTGRGDNDLLRGDDERSLGGRATVIVLRKRKIKNPRFVKDL